MQDSSSNTETVEEENKENSIIQTFSSQTGYSNGMEYFKELILNKDIMMNIGMYYNYGKTSD